jgi:hypothetical protein
MRRRNDYEDFDAREEDAAQYIEDFLLRVPKCDINHGHFLGRRIKDSNCILLPR